MVLSGSEISASVARGEITLEPFEPSLVNPNSYNYRLDPWLRVFRDDLVDARRTPETVDLVIPPEGLVLEPGFLYLGRTFEVIGSDDYVPSLIGRSSLGRLGVYLQVSADLGNLGARHQWTLEIVVCQRVRLYPLMRIGQVSFWVPVGEKKPYTGYFGDFSWPEPATPSVLGLAPAMEAPPERP